MSDLPKELIRRIIIDPAICHGKPCVRGLRYPVELLLELLIAGMTPAEILADYPDLEQEDILATLAFKSPSPPFAKGGNATEQFPRWLPPLKKGGRGDFL